ncbi:MAG: HAMP domain-containing sensor histidine kinase [Rothia sp. (in: high G+C Gram-positive bacteria)]|nr:HAMP domain-containing sensor histidine kinase [Rothia sp. (in: high G+C Gram-positive bacteria)]
MSASEIAHQKPQTWFASAPRLRTILTAILVGMLGIACLIVGLSSFLTLKNSLEAQMGGRLDEASHRALKFKPANASDTQNSTQNAPSGPCEEQQGLTPLDAPGQSAGTLSLCIQDNKVVFSGVLDDEGTSQSLSASDIAQLQNVAVDAEPQEVKLDAGDYLVVSHKSLDNQQITVVTGLPLKDMKHTLTTLGVVMIGGSLVVMLIAGLLGSLIIRRTMKPLERVSAVATNVAQSNLETQTLSHTERVSAEDSNPRSEVGAVGFALNQMLDNVQSALEARQRTEEQMRVFVADASHELRTPLAAIKGYSDLMRWTENLTESGEQSMSRIDSQTERMSKLVEDLLLLARLGEGKKPVMEEVDLTELLIENVSDLQVAAADHVWQLELPDEPMEVRGDKGQLEQVLLNLLSNARKHTHPGTTVTAGLHLATNGYDAVMTVRDNGQGIAPDFIDRIFDRFTRADQARSGSTGTTGLGLPIVKAIVEAHGGSIIVNSEPGNTEFAVQLPLI